MTKTFFVRTVPDASLQPGSVEDKLKIVVNNTGNYFFEAAVARQIQNYSTLNELEDLDEPDASLVLSMSNFISPATDLGDVARFMEAQKVARVVMVGAGAQAEGYGDAVALTPGTRRFLALLSERSASIGVRGDYTADVLNKLGIKNVDVIGCPSMFYSLDPAFQIHRQAQPPARIRTAFHCTPTGYYRDSIARLIAFGVQHCDAYIAQSESYLLGLASNDAEHLKNTEFFFHYYNDGALPHTTLREWFRDHTHWFFSLYEWLDFMRGFDFAMGSRFHGNMAALQRGVPALTMVFDTRTRELCEYLNLPHMHLKNFAPDASLRALYEAADFSLFNATYPAKYRAYRAFLMKNRLDVAMPACPERGPAHHPVQVQAIRRLTEDLLAAGQGPLAAEREMRLRLESGRGHDERLRAESGEFERAEPVA
jgi:hypothetical protein